MISGVPCALLADSGGCCCPSLVGRRQHPSTLSTEQVVEPHVHRVTPVCVADREVRRQLICEALQVHDMHVAQPTGQELDQRLTQQLS